MDNGDVTVCRHGCKYEHGRLTGKGGDESAELAQRAPLPVVVVDEIVATVVNVRRANHNQIDTHQEVREGEVEKQHGVHFVVTLCF